MSHVLSAHIGFPICTVRMHMPVAHKSHLKMSTFTVPEGGLGGMSIPSHLVPLASNISGGRLANGYLG